MCRDLSKWVQEGFNACLIAYGERSSGKTATMFGFDDSIVGGSPGISKTRMEEESIANGGIATALLKELYSGNQHIGGDGCSSSSSSSSSDIGSKAVTGNCSNSQTTIALSAWTLRGQRVVE